MKPDFSNVRLCVLVCDAVSTLPLARLVSEIVAGGADCIQLREKGIPDSLLLERALICREASGDAIFVVNDRPDIALLSEADGVHVGQEDLPGREARAVVGPDMLVGISTSRLEELEKAEADGADYLGVGAVFPTGTKDVEVKGLSYVSAAAARASVPFLAIGGITAENVGEVIAAGANAVAVFGAVVQSRDPRSAARRMKDAVLEATSK